MSTEATDLQSDDHGILPSLGPKNIESETAARDHQLSNKSSDNIDTQTHPFSKYTCTLCQGLSTRAVSKDEISYRIRPLDLHRDVPFAFFHEECAKCSEFSGAAASACSTCAHLRPWHLLFHAAPEYESILGLHSEPSRQLFFVRLGKLWEICIRAPYCGFCDFIAKRPAFLSSLAWTRIDILFDESGMMLFMEDRYVGDLRLDTQTTPTPPDYRRIDWETIKTSLACPSNQPSLNQESPGEMFDEFRLIDVTSNCVVRVSKPTKYAALSYVWGSSSEVQCAATKSTIADLEQEGGLLSANVPNTIRDAMIATKELGLRYLWVDRICIVQDDDSSNLTQIYRMDTIFGSSDVTLVAQFGEDATSGLPGVRMDRQRVIQAVHWNGLSLAFPYWPWSPGATPSSKRFYNPHWWRSQFGFLDQSNKTKWSRRGWTYQEAILSKRLLYFTHEGVRLVDENGVTFLVEGGTHGYTARRSTDPHVDYYEAVFRVSGREFTYSTDILLAFQGILNWIVERQFPFNKNHRFGMPFEEFDVAMQWKWIDSGYRQAKRISDKRHIFPSWSWASFEGQIYWRNRDYTCGSLATWAFCEYDEKKQLSLVPVMSRPKTHCDNWGFDERRGRDRRVFVMIAWLHGSFTKPLPFDFTLESPLTSVQEQIDMHFPMYHDFWQASRGERWQHEMFSPDDLRTAALHPGSVMVHTQCANLCLEKKEGYDELFHIRRPSGQWIGLVRLPHGSQEILSSLSTDYSTLCMEFLALNVDFDHGNELYWQARGLKKALSGALEPCPLLETQTSGLEDMNLCFHEMSYACTFPPDHKMMDEFPPNVVVMLIYRRGPVAYRLGLGEVFLKLWLETECELKTVVLG